VDLAGPAVVGLLLLAAILAAFCLAPAERTMGDAQRIVYVHVPVAWLGLLGMVAMAVSSVLYLSPAICIGTTGPKRRARSAGCAAASR
jgi:hypothetical protein